MPHSVSASVMVSCLAVRAPQLQLRLLRWLMTVNNTGSRLLRPLVRMWRGSAPHCRQRVKRPEGWETTRSIMVSSSAVWRRGSIANYLAKIVNKFFCIILCKDLRTAGRPTKGICHEDVLHCHHCSMAAGCGCCGGPIAAARPGTGAAHHDPQRCLPVRLR